MATAELKPDPVVAIAAEAAEFSGLLSHAGSTIADGGVSVAFSKQAHIGGREWLLLANGPGPDLAVEACRAALASVRPALLVSTGFCGAADPKLNVSGIFVATVVRSGDTEFATQMPTTDRPHYSGVLGSADQIVCTVEEKRALYQKGIEAVDMEAGAVARFASQHDLPFYCVRVVSDGATDPMPLNFNQYRDAAGRFDPVRIGMAAAMRPWLIPAILRLRRHCKTASKQLGDFLVHCSFVQ